MGYEFIYREYNLFSTPSYQLVWTNANKYILKMCRLQDKYWKDSSSCIQLIPRFNCYSIKNELKKQLKMLKWLDQTN